MKAPVEVRKLPDEYTVTIEGDSITVWDGHNGKTHPLEQLAPFTDDDN